MRLKTAHENTVIQMIREVLCLDSRAVFPHDQYVQLRPPKTPFVTVEIVRHAEQIGQDGIIDYIEDGLARQKTIGMRRCTFSFRFFGKDAHEMAELVSNSRRSPRVIKMLRAGFLGGLQSLGASQNLSSRVTTEIEQMFRQDYSAVYITETETNDIKPHMDTYEATVTLQRYEGSEDARTVVITPED